jgi:hypothetical protein
MKIRITGKGLNKYQNAGTVKDPNDAWIRKILEYEANKGSATGTGLSNFGYNNWQKLGHKNPPRSLDEAVEFYKQDFLPKVQQYPMGLRERMGDYIFNTGRNPNDLLLYNAGKITLDQLNSPNTFTNEWNQFSPEIEKQYSDPNFVNNLDASKTNVYRTTKQVNGQPNPAFEKTWQGRINMWGTYQAPTQQAAPKQVNPGSKTTYTLNGRTLDINNPVDAAIIKQKDDEIASDQAAINNYYAQKSNGKTGPTLQLANTLTKVPTQQSQLANTLTKLPSNIAMPKIGVPNLQPGLNQLKQTGNKAIYKIGQFGNTAGSFFANTANSFLKNLQNQPPPASPASAAPQMPQISGLNSGNQTTFNPTGNQSNPYTWMQTGQGLAAQPTQNAPAPSSAVAPNYNNLRAVNTNAAVYNNLMGIQPQAVGNNTPNALNLNGAPANNYAWSQPSSLTNSNPMAAMPAGPKQYATNNTPGKNLAAAKTMITQDANNLQNTFNTGSAKESKAAIANFNSTYGTNLKDPRLIKLGAKGRATLGAIGDASQALQATIGLADNVTSYIDNKNKQRDFNAYLREQQLSDNAYPVKQGSRGEWVQTGSGYGTFRPDQMVTNKGMYTAANGGSLNNNNMRIRITGGPERMEYGGQKGYGFDNGSKQVFTDMNDNSYDSVSNTIEEVPRSMANIEAEQYETVVGDIDGDGRMEHMKIGGKPHSKGGTPLNVPQGSFIFSKKLKEKDPETLKMFGKSYKKGGISYSDIAKQYDLNKYKGIIENPQADSTSKKTAQMMYDNNQKKLGMLSIAQEKSKGFPDGQLPQIAQMAMSQAQAAYGGYIPEMKYGGNTLPQFQGTKNASTVKGDLGEWSDDYETLKKLLSDPKNAELRKQMFSNYIKDYSGSPLKSDPKGEEKFINNFLESQRQFMGIRASYKDKPDQLATEDWDTRGKNTRYKEEAKRLGYSALDETDIKRFQGGYRALAKAARDPKFFESFGKYFKLSPIGVKDEEYLGQPISKDDSWVGNTTLGQLAQLRDDVVEDGGFVCDENGKAVPVASGGYKTAEEALKNCPQKSKTNPKFICVNGAVIESPTGVGFDTAEEARINCDTGISKQVPFDYLTPDKLNLLATAAQPVNKYFPYIPEKNYTKPTPVFESPERALAANAEQANIMTQGLANFAGPQAFMANATGVQGKAAENAANIMADVNNRNINRANEFELQRAQIFNREMDEKAARGERYSIYNATLNQNYDNAIGKKYKDVAKSYAQAWKQRAFLYNSNMNNQFMYTDPRSGKIEFRGNPGGFGSLGNYAASVNPYGGGTGGGGNLGSSFSSLYKNILNDLRDSDMTPEDKKRQAASLANMALRNNRMSATYDPFDPYNARIRRSGINFPNPYDDETE